MKEQPVTLPPPSPSKCSKLKSKTGYNARSTHINGIHFGLDEKEKEKEKEK